ncbi:MAG: SPFH domain-containing protein, partial [Pseudomonadota bacterium]
PILEVDHRFWKSRKVIKKNQNGRSSEFRTGDQVKPEWVINLGRNMHKVSTRSDISRTAVAKINDLSGNPIMAAMQGQWYVERPADSVFNIDKNVDEYVSEVFSVCLRTLISQYDYDGSSSEIADGSEDESEGTDAIYLRTSSDEINEKLKELAQERLNIAGVKVVSANLVDLAYAPEIASAMLQVQQAKAFLNARKKIVKGATGVALQAIQDLEKDGKSAEIEFDKKQKASLVSNLLVVLCGDTNAQPVISLDNPSA